MKYNLPKHIQTLLTEAVNEYGPSVKPNDDQVWELARQKENFPDFNEIYMELFFARLIYSLKRSTFKNLDYKYHINGDKSKIYYTDENGKDFEIKTIKPFKKNKNVGALLGKRGFTIKKNITNISQESWIDVTKLENLKNIEEDIKNIKDISTNYDNAFISYTIYKDGEVWVDNLSEEVLINLIKDYVNIF